MNAACYRRAQAVPVQVADESVPAGIPPAVPWGALEKQQKIPAKVKAIHGKLNVPRERFRRTENGGYVWARR